MYVMCIFAVLIMIKTKTMKKYNLTVQSYEESNKVYNTLAKARAVYMRIIAIAAANQKKYDGVQVLDYAAIDEVEIDENGNIEPVRFDIYYMDGTKLKKFAV